MRVASVVTAPHSVHRATGFGFFSIQSAPFHLGHRRALEAEIAAIDNNTIAAREVRRMAWAVAQSN